MYTVAERALLVLVPLIVFDIRVLDLAQRWTRVRVLVEKLDRLFRAHLYKVKSAQGDNLAAYVCNDRAV